LGGGGKFSKERNPLENFDADWFGKNKDKPWRKYDFNGKDWKNLISGRAAKIIKPWTDYSKAAKAYGKSQNRKVPDIIYTRAPPYDPKVVDIGGKGIPWVHQERSNDLSGETKGLLGKPYTFKKWGATIDSVPESASTPSAARDWKFDDKVYPEFGGGVGTPPTTFGGLGGK